MARGYLGKISAIVAVNTDDARSRLSASAKDFQRYARSVQSTIGGATTSAGRSFDAIFTPLQKLQRALAATQNGNLGRTLGLGIDQAEVTRVQQLVSAAEQLAKPLGSSVKQFAALSAEITGEFQPALVRAQSQVELARVAINQFGSISEKAFAGVEARVQSTTQAIARLVEVQNLVDGGRTGQELAFRAPRVQDELSRSAQLSQQAASLPVALREDPSVRARIEELARLRQEIARYQASVERRQVLGLDTREARAQLDGVIRRSSDVRESLEATIRVDVDSRAAQAEVDRLKASLATIRENVTFTVTGEVQNFDQARQELGRLTGAVEQFDVTQRSAFGARLQTLNELVDTGDLAELEQVRRLIAEIGAAVGQRLQLNLDTNAAEQAANRLAASIEQLQQNADFVITGRPQNLDQVRSQLDRVLGSLDQLDDAQRSGLQVRVNAVIEALGREDIDAARAALDQLQADASGTIAVNVNVEAARQRIRSINETWDEAVRGVPTTLAQVDSEFQALAGRISSLNIDDRLDLDPLIRDFRDSAAAGDPLIAQYERLLALQQRLDGIESRRNPVGPVGPDLPPGFGGASDAGLGRSLDDPRRQLDALRGGITSLKGQLDSLPAVFRTQFIPAIQQAETEFRRLAAMGPAATAEQIEQATREVDRLTQATRRAAQAANLLSFADTLDDTALRGAIGSLNALQQVLARVGAEAGSDAAAQFDRMRAAIQRATRDGTIGTEAFQNELRQLSREAANAAAATGRISANAAFRQIQRGGDIARGGFDNLSLAVQQAAFAIDDFFSSTGDFTQRIRAVQNNVTQLAFILGGTTGLFIGLGVAIAAQAGVAIYNWINSGRTAEDQTKALNDALARQKSLVEELAQAFESLGDAIGRRAFSEPAQQARQFAKEIDDIAKKQRELREGRIADIDPAVQRERANQNRIRRELDSSSDPAQRLLLQAELESSRTRERQARDSAVSRPPLEFGDLRALVSDSVDVEFASLMRGRRAPTRREVEQRERDRQAAIENLGDGTDLRATRAGLQDRLTGLRNSRFANDEIVRNAALQLEQQIAAIDSAIQAGIEQTVSNIIKSSLGAALAIEQAQADVADAIRRGVSGAAGFQAALDNTAQQLVDAQKQLQDAQANESLSPEARDRAIRRAEDRVRDIENRREAINEQARVLRLTTGRGGERTTAALSALQGNEDFSNEYGRLVARLRAAIDEELAAQRELNQQIAKRRKIEEDATLSDAQKQAQLQQQESDEAEARARVERAAADSDLAAATAEAAQAMNKALSRIKKIGEDALSQSTQLADDAQRNFTRDPTSANRRARDEAERQLISDRERVARANNALARARSEAEGDPVIRGINDQLRAIEDERKRLSDEAAQNNTQVDPREAERLANEEARLLAEREQRLQSLTQAEREQADIIAWEIDARRRLIEQLERERQFDEELRRRRSPDGDATRGLDLLETPAQRAARELQQGLADINAAVDEQLRSLLEASNGLPNSGVEAEAAGIRQQRAEAEARLIDQSMRAAAPAIFALSDSVENAVLQGPSRAALGVADISTQDGARELNRLLRGDDSARDQNLVELQKQSQALEEIQRTLREGVNGVRAA